MKNEFASKESRTDCDKTPALLRVVLTGWKTQLQHTTPNLA